MCASHPHCPEKERNPHASDLCHLSRKSDSTSPTEHIPDNPFKVPKQMKKPAGKPQIKWDEEADTDGKRKKTDTETRDYSLRSTAFLRVGIRDRAEL